MSGRTEIELVLDQFLAEGPETVADHALTHALDRVDRTTQRRGGSASWRLPPMNTYARLAAAAVVAVIAVGGALYLIGPRGGVGDAHPSPSPSPTVAAASAAAVPEPTAFTFRSFTYGYSAEYPIGWQRSGATETWAGQTNSEMWVSSANAPWVDKTYDSGSGVTMTGVAIPFAPGTEEGPWIEAYLAEPVDSEATCVALASDMTSIVIDGRPARLATKCDESHIAYVVADGRIYVFAISVPSDPATFTDYVSSIRLPEAAPAPS